MVYNLKRLRNIGLCEEAEFTSCCSQPGFLNIMNSVIINLYYACAYCVRGRRPGAVLYYIIIHYNKYVLLRSAVQRWHNIRLWSWTSCGLYDRIYIGTRRVLVVYINIILLYGTCACKCVHSAAEFHFLPIIIICWV